VKALMEDKSLHSLIIETLTRMVHEDQGVYQLGAGKKTR